MITGSLPLNFDSPQCQLYQNGGNEELNKNINNNNLEIYQKPDQGQSGSSSIDSNNSSNSSLSGNNGNFTGYLEGQNEYYETSSDTQYIPLSPFGENRVSRSNGQDRLDENQTSLVNQSWNNTDNIYMNSNVLKAHSLAQISNRYNEENPVFQQSIENILLCDLVSSSENETSHPNETSTSNFQPNNLSFIPFISTSDSVQQQNQMGIQPPSNCSSNQQDDVYSRNGELLLYQMNKDFEHGNNGCSTDAPFTPYVNQAMNDYINSNTTPTFTLINDADNSGLYQNYSQSLLNTNRLSENMDIEEEQNMEKQYTMNYSHQHQIQQQCQSSLFLQTGHTQSHGSLQISHENMTPSLHSTSTSRSYNNHRGSSSRKTDTKGSKVREETPQERDKRVRNNEASRRSRAAKKIRVEAIINETENLHVENRRLELLLEEIILAICDAKELLIKNYKQQ